VQDILDLRK